MAKKKILEKLLTNLGEGGILRKLSARAASSEGVRFEANQKRLEKRKKVEFLSRFPLGVLHKAKRNLQLSS